MVQDSISESNTSELLCESVMEDIDTGHITCHNRYQVLNDLNKFGQDKYLGTILKQRRIARANQPYYMINLLDSSVKNEEPQNIILNEIQTKSVIHNFSTIKCQIAKTSPSTREIYQYLDDTLGSIGCQQDSIHDKYGKNVIFCKLGHNLQLNEDELGIWVLSRKQLSKHFNGDADDMKYYYLTWNADPNDYFYASYM